MYREILRLTPVYAVILGFIATLMIYTTYGPKWENINFVSKTSCRYNWWNNLLYVNNYIHTYPYDVSKYGLFYINFHNEDDQCAYFNMLFILFFLVYGRDLVFSMRHANVYR